MGTPLRVLIVEDSADDAELIVRELGRGGYDAMYRRVDTAEAFVAALDAQKWDVILCDYTMPRLSGTQALSLLRSRGDDVPFIYVSGTMGEDLAVAAMKAGAQDYLIKGRLKRLVPVIERELREIEMRRERARAEAERRASDARFRQILTMAADAIVAVDADQRITLLNRAAEAIFGYRAEEVKGQFLDLLLPAGAAARHRRHIEEFARAPDVARRMFENGEVVGRRKSGEEFPLEASISKLTEDGRTTFTAILRDITERKRVEDRLRQLMRAVEQSANFVIITDANGVISYVNPAFLKATGYMADEVIGARPSLWRSGQTGEPTYAALWETIRAGNDWHGEFQNRRKDGSLVSVSAVISPIKDESGRITHFIGIQEDVTQRREMEAQLRHAQRIETIGRLTGGLAHDFNNLLTVVIGNLELLEHRLAADPTARQLAAMAGKAAERGAELTRQLLAFARRQPLTAKAFDVNALVAGTTNLLRRTLGEQINVRMMLADDLSHAFADPTQVESALTNLAINSRDAMPGGGRLTIETANQRLDERYAAENLDVAPGDYVMLAVSDTGTGMPPEILSRVFEPFFTTKAEGKGSGLGLSMVYGFAKQSRGHVKIYSEVGHGTTVRLYLPRAAGNAAAAADATAADAESATIEATILVVEDNADVRRVAVGMLADLGCRVIEAENAAAALAILVTGQPIDLLFTDIVMPGGMTGVELAREARKLRAGLKVLFTSGFADAPLRNGGEADENKNLLRKPYRKPELARWIRRILAGNGPRS